MRALLKLIRRHAPKRKVQRTLYLMNICKWTYKYCCWTPMCVCVWVCGRICVFKARWSWVEHSMKMNCAALFSKTTLNMYVFWCVNILHVWSHMYSRLSPERWKTWWSTLIIFLCLSLSCVLLFFIKLHCTQYEEYAWGKKTWKSRWVFWKWSVLYIIFECILMRKFK